MMINTNTCKKILITLVECLDSSRPARSCKVCTTIIEEEAIIITRTGKGESQWVTTSVTKGEL